jgi:hypothetical protein
MSHCQRTTLSPARLGPQGPLARAQRSGQTAPLARKPEGRRTSSVKVWLPKTMVSSHLPAVIPSGGVGRPPPA